MNPFTAHPEIQAITYTGQLTLAMGIAIRLAQSVIAFCIDTVFLLLLFGALDLQAKSRYLLHKITGSKTSTPVFNIRNAKPTKIILDKTI